ncbi:unnamed protein product [Periconia digitata]|uniref:Uncharacterized protein n=1 Tax=Periconia digitata TaxID=1303443 RepID=A0A9W4UV95_9PLEO|nr:unnamed protein product [Periconia digitata]
MMASDFHFGRNTLDDPSRFDPIDDHLYIRISKTNSQIKHSVEKKRDDELLDVFESQFPAHKDWSFELLLSPQPYHYTHDRKRLPFPERLPYSKDVVKALQTKWSIADVCFYAHLKSGSCSMRFTPKPFDHGWIGYTIRMIYSVPFRCCLATSHNTTTRTTHAIVFGITPSDAPALLSTLLTAKSHAHHPCLAPLLLCDMALTRLEAFSYKTYHDFLPVREAMGCNLYFNEGSVYTAPDLADMPRRLTALLNAGASNTASVRAAGVVVADLEGLLDVFRAGKESEGGGRLDGRKGETEADEEAEDVVVKMRDHLALLRQVVGNMKRRNEYLKESVQAQVQMVYALLAQQDNALSHRYGADMRVIAAVTLVFLPGTFVATLFSASFWDFSPANSNGPHVSSWVWLYVVVTISLTAAVLAVWKGALKGVGWGWGCVQRGGWRWWFGRRTDGRGRGKGLGLRRSDDVM